ncbi:MAG: BrnA antitoxin family protein [Brevundimonas sp.]|uniref:BrnA antitoxin family protein n=1 Tax=Brevundimonas sp. TaxID=1871086 RepID=UPI00391CC228
MVKHDDENPILDAAFFAEARPAGEVLSADAIAAFRAKGGRPKADQVKTPVSIRLDPDLLLALKATGPGWQSRVNGLLRDAVLPEKRTSAAPGGGAKARAVR